jgi:SAM-dependent methyltransferase
MIQPKPIVGLLGLPAYLQDWRSFNRYSSGERLRLADSYPCLVDRVTATPFDPHYFYQSAWLARRLGAARPLVHVDIGSSVLMIGVLSGLVDTVFLDYRPLRVILPGLYSVAATTTQLPFADGTIDSLSCLHVIEHIGLGRYGDPVDPDGSRKAALELQRVMRPGGRLYLSAPVGRERVCFNAHRVFAPETLPAWMRKLRLRDFAFVDDAGRFVEGDSVSAAAPCSYACGMYAFERPSV